MASPTFDRTKHDAGIGGKGYMVPPGGRVVRQDAVPATARAAIGEGRYDLFQEPAFYAQGTFSGGAGQARLLSTDSYLSGVCDSRWQGAVFPARKLQTATSSGGTASFMFHRDATVYGFVGTNIEQFGSSSTFAAGGAPRNQPVVDGNDDVFYVTTANALCKWTGTGSATNITSNLGSGVTPYAVASYNRYLWCLAMKTYESTPTPVQSVAATGTQHFHSIRLNRRPIAGNLMTLAIATVSAATVEHLEDQGWTLARSNTDNASAKTWLYYKVVEPFERGYVEVELTQSTLASMILSEWEGMDPDGVLDVKSGASATAATSVSPGSVTTTEADALVLVAHAGDSATAMAPPSGYTELREESGTGIRLALSYKVLAATATENPSATSTTSGNLSAVLAAFKGNTITTDSTQFAMLYSKDGGATWALAFPDMATGIEKPTAATAAGGFLFFTTPRGLYQAGIDDTEFLDGSERINIFLRGKLDVFARPSGTPATGRTPDNFAAGWLAFHDGALFYPLGQTLRSFPIGGQAGRQVWPTDDWGTAGGDLKAVVSGEGGVYFAAGNTLWNYNQRGFHPLATNSTSGIYDYLYWHDGKLYVKTDPAQYYDFGYPSLRPDIANTAATMFETGYLITSLLDFEKVDVYKHISAFQSMATFSAAANSGTITWSYLSADSGITPERQGGGATSLSWTTLGTHEVTDGNVKNIALTPIKATAIWLRATIAPGASGYPIVQVPVLVGRAIMPTLKRFVANIHIATGIKDKAGALMYADTAAAFTALDELNDLRNGTNTFTVEYVEPDGGSTSYTCTADQMEDSTTDWKKTSIGVDGAIQFVALQLPATSASETAPGGGGRT